MYLVYNKVTHGRRGDRRKRSSKPVFMSASTYLQQKYVIICNLSIYIYIHVYTYRIYTMLYIYKRVLHISTFCILLYVYVILYI
jgi:hypothetical protein